MCYIQAENMANWKDGYNPQILLADLQNSLTLTSEGEVSLRDSRFQVYAPALLTAIKFSPQIFSALEKDIIRASIVAAFKAKKLTKDYLISEVRKRESEYLQKRLKRFVLISEIALKASHKYPKYKIDACTIIIGKLPKNFTEARQSFLRWGRHHVHGELPQSYVPVRIYSSGRSPEEAGEKALNTINLLRAFWNLSINFSKTFRSSSGKRKPINEITMGPLHSIHYESGKNIAGPFWHDPLYVSSIDVIHPSNEWITTLKNEKNLRQKLQKSRFREIIENALSRYVDALDERNFQASFLKLWSLLEYLTNTTRANYEVTIKRTIFIFKNKDLHKEILNYIRESRNKLVHSDESLNEEESLMFQSKLYVEKMILFYLHYGNKFKDINELSSFLDLPANRDVLTTRRKIVELGIKFSNLRQDT